MLLIGKPSINGHKWAISHGYVSHNQRVIISVVPQGKNMTHVANIPIHLLWKMIHWSWYAQWHLNLLNRWIQ